MHCVHCWKIFFQIFSLRSGIAMYDCCLASIMYQASMHTRNWIGPGYLLINLESLSVLQTGILFSQGSVWLFLEHLCMIDLLTARSSNNLPDDNFSASGDILEFLLRELLSGVIELYRVNLIVSSLIISRKTDRLLSVFRRVRVNKTKVAALKKFYP